MHWDDLPIALAPTPNSVDEYGVFSGCAFNANGMPTVLYTGVRKPADGPGSRYRVSRPATMRIWEGDAWYQIIGAGIRGVGGTAFPYRSSDLLQWEYLHPISIGDRTETGDIWECSDLFELGDQHVLMVSPIPLRKTLYFLGSFRDHRFEPQHQGVVDDGGYFYAPQSFTDAHGRRIMFGWLWEGREESAQRAAGWAGVMSLPRVLVPRTDGVLGVEPAEELRSLRRRHTGLGHSTVSPVATTSLGIQGVALEIVAEFRQSQATQFGLKVRCAPDGREQTLIAFDPAHPLAVDRARALQPGHGCRPRPARHARPAGGR